MADTVEAYENTDIADKYNVMSVPVIAINGEVAFVGLPYEVDFVEKVKELS
ncbi:thioredoxin family protein [Fervidicoccus sp.]|uniref:thioredoxin family protein n=1 Tax=Fervidicoccus sp. TaxID=2060324 RepID=UPI003D0A384C